MPNGVIRLAEDRLELFGRGSNRLCFLDPRAHDRCLKLEYSTRGTTSSVQEEREYRRLFRSLGGDYAGLARNFDPVRTSHGPAVVRELIRDEIGGDISKSLIQRLDVSAYRRQPSNWDRALSEFRNWLLRHAVLATDMTPENIVVQRRSDGRLRLVLVDGLGHHDRWPLLELSKTARRAKLLLHIRKRGLVSIDALLVQVDLHRARIMDG